MKGDLIASYSFLRMGCGERSAEFISLVSTDRTRGNGSKLHQGRFRLDMKKHFLTERVIKHCNSLAVKEPFLSNHPEATLAVTLNTT